jgi:hypothetical protein
VHNSALPCSATPSVAAAAPYRMNLPRFIALTLLFVLLGIVRSAIATRTDSFTLDEPYHIAAGVSYIRYRDFRINPEHPPLVKLWVGSVVAATGFYLDPLRKFADKPDERIFSGLNVFRKNDPDSVQRRARLAMFTFNGLLLIAFAFVLQRVFNATVALGALLFLVIDPTIAAHWPVVMTDLPVALLTAITVVLASRAFHDWVWTDLAACSVFLGLDLAVKHSAPVVWLSVALIGAWLSFRPTHTGPHDATWRRLAKTGAVLAGALVILWGTYFFRYSETPSRAESFNRPLSEKIRDINTPFYHFVLIGMDTTHIVPRAYLWGFADTIRAGMEGRLSPQTFFGKLYVRKGPWYFFPAMIAVKLPLGLGALSLLGMVFFLSRLFPKQWNLPAAVVLAGAILYLLVLAQGATYAGIRHALPVVALMAIFAGLFVERSLATTSRELKIVSVVAFGCALISAAPVLRPWEYFNEFVGGTSNAYKYFDDEGVDLGQRSKEVVAYYRECLKSSGEMPDLIYTVSDEELQARGVDYLGRDKVRDMPRLSDPHLSGTFFIGATYLTPNIYWDRLAFREATPVVRFGNVFVYRGNFYSPPDAAVALFFDGIEKLYTHHPDAVAAEKAFQQSRLLDPTAYFVDIELGNLLLERGMRDDALHAYSEALRYAPADQRLRLPIERQIALLKLQPPVEVRSLRDPALE